MEGISRLGNQQKVGFMTTNEKRKQTAKKPHFGSKGKHHHKLSRTVTITAYSGSLRNAQFLTSSGHAGEGIGKSFARNLCQKHVV